MVGDSYWYCDYIGLEPVKEQTRHILGLRFWSQDKGTKKQTIFLKRNIPIPTKFIFPRTKAEIAKRGFDKLF